MVLSSNVFFLETGRKVLSQRTQCRVLQDVNNTMTRISNIKLFVIADIISSYSAIRNVLQDELQGLQPHYTSLYRKINDIAEKIINFVIINYLLSRLLTSSTNFTGQSPGIEDLGIQKSKDLETRDGQETADKQVVISICFSGRNVIYRLQFRGHCLSPV